MPRHYARLVSSAMGCLPHPRRATIGQVALDGRCAGGTTCYMPYTQLEPCSGTNRSGRTHLAVALVQKLRLSLHPVLQVTARQTSALFVNRTGTSRDLFFRWPGLVLLGSCRLGLLSVVAVFHFFNSLRCGALSLFCWFGRLAGATVRRFHLLRLAAVQSDLTQCKCWFQRFDPFIFAPRRAFTMG